MEKIILEVMKDSGKRPDYRIFSSMVISMGRAYDNDLIVSDPHVSQMHCMLRAHEHGYTLEDLGSLNGTWLMPVASQRQEVSVKADSDAQEKTASLKLKNKIHVQERVSISSGDIILIGQTRIRFMVSSHEVEAAKPMIRPNAFFEEINSPGKAWLIVTSAVMLGCVVEHQESVKNLPISKFVSVSIGLIFAFLIWSGIWSFAGWLIKRKSFFNAHLSWVTLFFLGMTLTYPLADHMGYIFCQEIVEMAVGSFIFWVFIAALVVGHLIIATHIARRYQIIASAAISTAIVVFGLVSAFAGKPQFNPLPDLYGTLIPPYARVMPGDSIDQFLNKSNRIFVFKSNE